MKTTLKGFLQESTFLQADEISPEEAAEMINTRGKQWEKFIGGYKTDNLNWVAYRGMMERFSPDICVKYPRTNRRPLTTDKHSHYLADEYFKETFGISFRSNSIFVSRSAELAKYYGDVYAVFPLDNVSFAWSEEVEDFTHSLDVFKKKTIGTFHEGPAKELSKEEIAEFIKSMEYHHNDSSLSSTYVKFRDFKKHEVMIHCDEYLAIRAEALPAVLNLLD